MKGIKATYIGVWLALTGLFLGVYFNINSWKEDVIKDAFIKNIKWDSPLQKDVPYSIGNELELFYILDNKKGTAKINLEKLSEKIDIQSIEFWDKKIEPSTTITITTKENTPLKITGKSKVNNNSKDSDIKDLVSVNLVDPEIISDEIIQEPEITNIKEPGNIIITQKNFNSNINNILEFSWDNLENVLYINIGSYSFSPRFKDGKGYVLIDKWTFPSWSFFVFIQSQSWKIIPLEDQIRFVYSDKKISIAHITPSSIKNDKKRSIVLQWDGFNDLISIQLNNNLIIKDDNFKVISNWVLQLDIPKWLDPGRYSINAMTTENIIKIDNTYFNVIK